MKKYSEMTEDERAEHRAWVETIVADEKATKAFEAALDELLAFLKASKRKRPAPTRLYQFPDFSAETYLRLIATVAERQEHLGQTSRLLYGIEI